jgi:hypothetical protein
VTSSRHTGLIATIVGIAVMTNGETPGIRYIAIGVWWFGMVLMINMLIHRDGLLRLLLPASALVATAFAWTPAAPWLIVGYRGLWLAIPTLGLRLAISFRLAQFTPPRPESR